MKMRFLPILCALLLAACGGPPDVYAPPVPRRPDTTAAKQKTARHLSLDAGPAVEVRSAGSQK
jgi:hypothetical protein